MDVQYKLWSDFDCSLDVLVKSRKHPLVCCFLENILLRSDKTSHKITKCSLASKQNIWMWASVEINVLMLSGTTAANAAFF